MCAWRRRHRLDQHSATCRAAGCTEGSNPSLSVFLNSSTLTFSAHTHVNGMGLSPLNAGAHGRRRGTASEKMMSSAPPCTERHRCVRPSLRRAFLSFLLYLQRREVCGCEAHSREQRRSRDSVRPEYTTHSKETHASPRYARNTQAAAIHDTIQRLPAAHR